MNKYFVKYKKYVGPSSNQISLDKTRFFDTDDIEAEWEAFKNISGHKVQLVDITPLPPSTTAKLELG